MMIASQIAEGRSSMTHKSLLLWTAAALTLMLTTATTSQAARHYCHHGASQFAPGHLAARPGGARFFAPGHRQTMQSDVTSSRGYRPYRICRHAQWLSDRAREREASQ